MQERHNHIANALELCLHCTNPSIWFVYMSNLDNIYVVFATRSEVHLENVGSCMTFFLYTVTQKSPQCHVFEASSSVEPKARCQCLYINTIELVGDIGCITKKNVYKEDIWNILLCYWNTPNCMKDCALFLLLLLVLFHYFIMIILMIFGH